MDGSERETALISGIIPRHRSRGGLHDAVVRALARRILGGEIPPGAPLPTESRLTGELGVSRSVVREAIRVLADKGLIVVRPKTGSQVRPPRDWNQLDPDILEWRAEAASDPKFFSDLVELRRSIEPAAAELAATRATAEAIQAIEEAYRGMERAGGREEAVVRPDVAFHRAILEASGNDLLASLGGVIEAALAISFRFSSVADDAVDRSLPLHEAVLVAIRRRRPKIASAAMRRLIQAPAEDIDEVLKAAEPRQEADIA